MPYTQFVKTADNPTVFGLDASGKATAFSDWNQLLQANNNQAPNIQTVAQAPIGAADTGGRAYAPLPQLNQAGQASYAAPVDPLTDFHDKIRQLLTDAQNANKGNDTLRARAGDLAIGQTQQSMAPASELGIQGLRPGDALNARQNEGNLYNPEIKALNDRMASNNEAVDRFTKTIQAAKDWGEEYLKAIKPDDMTIQAVQMQMRAGIKPTADVLAKVAGSLTQADWDALAAAGGGGSKPAAIAEYEYAKSQGYSGTFQQWTDRNGGGGAPTTQTERLIAEREGITAKIRGLTRGKNGFANPNDYIAQASLYVDKDGTVDKLFTAVPPELYLSPTDAAYVRKLLGGSGRST